MYKICNLPRPHIGFLGILQSRIDSELLEKIARTYKHASLILVGPVWSNEFDSTRLEKLDNVYFMGAASYQEIPLYYNCFDVGIITYKKDDFIQSTNSMKYYEYLAAGLPVVTTWSGGVERFEDIMYVAKDHDEFLDMLGVALEKNTPDLKKQRKEYIADMTWAARVAVLLDGIESHYKR
jgi:glycosyltransferase involved in cell wall biosynthesis